MSPTEKLNVEISIHFVSKEEVAGLVRNQKQNDKSTAMIVMLWVNAKTQCARMLHVMSANLQEA